VISIGRSSFSIEPLIFLFEGNLFFKCKKPVSAANAKISGLSNSMGRPLQITDGDEPTS
jgi:hypothetical protein